MHLPQYSHVASQRFPLCALAVDRCLSLHVAQRCFLHARLLLPLFLTKHKIFHDEPCVSKSKIFLHARLLLPLLFTKHKKFHDEPCVSKLCDTTIALLVATKHLPSCSCHDCLVQYSLFMTPTTISVEGGRELIA